MKTYKVRVERKIGHYDRNWIELEAENEEFAALLAVRVAKQYPDSRWEYFDEIVQDFIVVDIEEVK